MDIHYHLLSDDTCITSWIEKDYVEISNNSFSVLDCKINFFEESFQCSFLPEHYELSEQCDILQPFVKDVRNETEPKQSKFYEFMNSSTISRVMLIFVSILYGTNFPLTALINDACPPSIALTARFFLASVTLFPFVFKLKRNVLPKALLGGCFDGMAYITQSLALVNTSPSKVAFLGTTTVIICPVLQFLVDKRNISILNAPQIWISAFLCLVGVGILELYDPSGVTTVSGMLVKVELGDGLAILSAVFNSINLFINEKIMSEAPTQALPVTAIQVTVTALFGMMWCLSIHMMGIDTEIDSHWTTSLLSVTKPILWTSIVSTALARVMDVFALAKLNSSEASVILASESLWAAIFSAFCRKEVFRANDYIGGTLITTASLAQALEKSYFDQCRDIFRILFLKFKLFGTTETLHDLEHQ